MVSPCAGVARQYHLLDSGVGRDTQEERDSSGNNGCGIADHISTPEVVNEWRCVSPLLVRRTLGFGKWYIGLISE